MFKPGQYDISAWGAISRTRVQMVAMHGASPQGAYSLEEET